MITTAVIMAAGLGTRFGAKTELIPKSFIEVSGKSMIRRSIETLIDCGIQRVIIGTGYKSELFDGLKVDYPQVETIFSEKYATTNSMWTLDLCKELVGSDDFLLLESDLIYEKRAITALLEDCHDNIMLISDVIKFQDQYFVEHNSESVLTNCSVNKDDLTVCGELVGIFKISNGFYAELTKYYQTQREAAPKMGYEFGVLHIAQTTQRMHTLKVQGLQWYEIDDDNDLLYAEGNIRV